MTPAPEAQLPGQVPDPGPKIDPSKLPTGLIVSANRRERLLAQLRETARTPTAADLPKETPPPDRTATLLFPFLLLTFPNWSYGLQARGDCMAWSAGHTVDVLMGVQIHLLNSHEQAPALTSIEAQYGFMRVEVHGGRKDTGGDGADPADAARSVIECGTLHRLQYLDNRWDLRTYDQTGTRSGQWGRNGVPDELEPIAKDHRVEDVTLCDTFDQAVALINRGVPVSNASTRNPIYRDRDADGFGTNPWRASHAMNYIGYRLGKRPGLLQVNTGHGYHCSGPRWPEDLPDVIAHCGSWVDAKTCDQVLNEGWSWGYAQYQGFPRQTLAARAAMIKLVHPTAP